jgi:hypothetical protein
MFHRRINLITILSFVLSCDPGSRPNIGSTMFVGYTERVALINPSVLLPFVIQLDLEQGSLSVLCGCVLDP